MNLPLEKVILKNTEKKIELYLQPLTIIIEKIIDKVLVKQLKIRLAIYLIKTKFSTSASPQSSLYYSNKDK
jgi:hypothetical protein